MSGSVDVRVLLAPNDRERSLERDVRQGLGAQPKSLPPIWFYDARGSELFEDITRLPEYYLTRAETAILRAHAPDVVEQSGARTLVELGSGSSEKTRLLLDAMVSAGSLAHFVPFDVSESALTDAAERIAKDYDIPVTAIVGDFERHLADIGPGAGHRLVVFLGSTIGNLDPPRRRRFLADLRATMQEGDTFLLGTDLVKEASRLRAAYDDAAGVTAEFNLNVLSVLNNELGADFHPERFEHVARWNEDEQRIEMRLRSTAAQTARFGSFPLAVSFEDGEEVLTEISSKFTPSRVASELADAGFATVGSWTDPAGDFLLTLARPAA